MLALFAFEPPLRASRIRSLTVVTAGAQSSTTPLSQSVSKSQGHGSSWGFARSLRLEYPSSRMVSADMQSNGHHLERLVTASLSLDELESADSERAFCRSSAMSFVTRLRPRITESIAKRNTDSAGSGGFATYIVTGGLGGLGLRAASLFADNGLTNVVLSSRSGVTTQYVGQALDTWLATLLRHPLCDVTVQACDVSDAFQSHLMARSATPGLRGILHAAGTAGRPQLLRTAEPSFDTAFQPKACGASHIHESVSQLPLSSMILFSSVAAVYDNMGVAGYAAANAALDSFACGRCTRALVGNSLQWPQVEGDMGMGAFGILMGLNGSTQPHATEHPTSHAGEPMLRSTQPHATERPTPC